MHNWMGFLSLDYTTSPYPQIWVETTNEKSSQGWYFPTKQLGSWWAFLGNEMNESSANCSCSRTTNHQMCVGCASFFRVFRGVLGMKTPSLLCFLGGLWHCQIVVLNLFAVNRIGCLWGGTPETALRPCVTLGILSSLITVVAMFIWGSLLTLTIHCLCFSVFMAGPNNLGLIASSYVKCLKTHMFKSNAKLAPAERRFLKL